MNLTFDLWHWPSRSTSGSSKSCSDQISWPLGQWFLGNYFLSGDFFSSVNFGPVTDIRTEYDPGGGGGGWSPGKCIPLLGRHCETPRYYKKSVSFSSICAIFPKNQYHVGPTLNSMSPVQSFWRFGLRLTLVLKQARLFKTPANISVPYSKHNILCQILKITW